MRTLITFLLFSGLSHVSLAAGPYTSIIEEFNLNSGLRPALSEDGFVLTAGPQRLIRGDGTTQTTIDLAPHGLQVLGSHKPVQMRSGGESVFLASSSSCPRSPGGGGAYRILPDGSGLTELYCGRPPERMGYFISLSNNGQVAIGTINDGTYPRTEFGAIMRGPSTGPLTVLRGVEPETYPRRYLLDNDIDISDSGAVAVLLSQSIRPDYPPEAGNIAIYTEINQPIETTLYALESHNTVLVKMAMNNNEIVALASNHVIPYRCRSEAHRSGNAACPASTEPAGVYLSTPTLFGQPKQLTQLAALSDTGYCWFGSIDINDNNDIVFEARVAHESGDCMRSPIEIFSGGDPVNSKVVGFGDENLESHQYYDELVLGFINNANQVSFMTTYSEPLVHSHNIWRTDLDELPSEPSDGDTTGILITIIRAIAALWEWFINLL